MHKFNLMRQIDRFSIRPASTKDLNDIVEIHLITFDGFFLRDLGKGFLYKYYTCIKNYNLGILLVAIIDGEAVGFTAGFLIPSKFYMELRRAKISLAFSILPAIIKNPGRIGRLFVNYKRTKSFSQDQNLNQSIAELSSISVKPGQKKGLGTELTKAFIQQAKELGATEVRLTTDTYHNNRVNAFYQKQGFSSIRTFEAQPGRWLNEYRKRM